MTEPITPESESEPESSAAAMEPSQDDAVESTPSVWNTEAHIDQSEEMIENTGAWSPDPDDESFSDAKQSSDDAGFASDENVDDEPVAEAGGLASLLIADLEKNSDSSEETPADLIANDSDDITEDSIGQSVAFDQSRFQDEEPVASSDDEEEPVGLMSLLADEPLSEDQSLDQDGEVVDSTVPSENASWDREYLEESDSKSIAESESDSVWDIDSDSDEDVESVASEASQSEEHHGMTAMMPSLKELEDEESTEASHFVDDEQIVEPSEAEPVGSVESETSAEMTSGDGQEEVEDDSIEAYMNRLLGRVQGTPGTDDKSATESVSLSTSSVSLEPTPESESANLSSPMAPQPEIDPDAPLVPRSHAPERNSDLSAMRDLANQSARTAISRSTRIQTRNMQMAGVMNFGVALVAVLFGLGSGFLLSGALLYLAWLMAAIVAAISIRDGLRNLADARARMNAAQRGELPDAIEEVISGEGGNSGNRRGPSSQAKRSGTSGTRTTSPKIVLQKQLGFRYES